MSKLAPLAAVLGAVRGKARLVCAAAGIALAVLVQAVTSRYGIAPGLVTLGGGAAAAHLLGRHCGHLDTIRDVRHSRRC